MMMLCFFLNHIKLSKLSIDSTKAVEEVNQGKSIGSIKSFMQLCKKELSDYLVDSQSIRKQYISDPKNYVSSVFQALQYKDIITGRCLEKIYTFSKNHSEMSFPEYKKKMIEYMEGDYFTTQYNKFYSTIFVGRDLEKQVLKKVFHRMLEIIESKGFKFIQEEKEFIPEEAKKFVLRLYLIDMVSLEFDINENDINSSKVFQTDKELRKMYSEITKAIE